MTVLPPQTAEQATALLDSYATLERRLAQIEADRADAIAKINAPADALALPLVDERKAIVEALRPWWAAAAPELTKGKRKSIELGGCKIGTRTAAERVEFALGDDKLALKAVEDQPFKGKVTQTKRVLDKAAVAVLLKGKSAAGAALTALGFRLGGGEETFFVTIAASPDAKVSAR